MFLLSVPFDRPYAIFYYLYIHFIHHIMVEKTYTIKQTDNTDKIQNYTIIFIYKYMCMSINKHTYTFTSTATVLYSNITCLPNFGGHVT